MNTYVIEKINHISVHVHIEVYLNKEIDLEI